LYTIVKLSPKFLNENKHLYIFVIAGLLDTDHQTSFIYEYMLQLVDSPNAAQIKSAVALVHRASTQILSYDRLYIQPPSWEDADSTRSNLLQIITKQTPPVASLLLHKMANALDYMSPTEKLRQLTLIKFWGQTSGKLDAYLMQVLIPLCTSLEENMQLEALKVIRALMPGFADANTTDTSFIWSYIYPLLDPSHNAILLKEAIGLLKMFPLTQLASAAREQLMNAMLKLFFYSDHTVRIRAYKFIGSCGEVWKAIGEFPRAISLLFLALGDSDATCVKTLIEQIQVLGAGMILPLNATLLALKEATNKSMLTQIKAYDNLCIALAINKIELRTITDALVAIERTDQFWNFFLNDVQENQLARSDEYDYSRNYIANPFWIALLCTKFNVRPPPSDPTQRRDLPPMTVGGKRKFACGFMFCLFPAMGMPEPNMRFASCVTAIRCCFIQTNAQQTVLRGFMDILTRQMLASKQTAYQL
jgi:hypothetical protein